ncbi:MAG: methanogenesis marker protein Mmp4/MtxX [Methanocellales archaeon]|nr:methanogenesis marker protein Mmp4/MtxX [Methanocellales archaeon]
MEKTVRYAELAEEKGYAKVMLVGSMPIDTSLEHVETGHPEEVLIQLLDKGEVDAVVRGSLCANKTLKAIRDILCPQKILRVALLATSEKMFFLAPVGIDEGCSVEDKIDLGFLGADLIRRFGVEPEIGILSGGRFSDMGRDPRVDKSLQNGEVVASALKAKGLSARHHGILIEDAIKECNYIIAPDGISGNLIFRSLCFLGDGEAIGAPLVGMEEVFVDTSRAGHSYDKAICLASSLSQS